jgi:uncharacterized membrane protein
MADEEEDSTNHLALGIALGSVFGMLLGLLFFDNAGMGLALGAGMGVALGAGLQSQRTKKKDDDASP